MISREERNKNLIESLKQSLEKSIVALKELDNIDNICNYFLKTEDMSEEDGEEICKLSFELIELMKESLKECAKQIKPD